MEFQSNQPRNTKQCKYCGSNIPEQAKVCPYCNKKQSHTVRNIVLIVVGIIVLLILLFSCMGGGGSSSSETETTTTTTTEDSAVEQTQQNYTVGSTFEENGISVTLNSVTQSTGGQFNVPADGNVYLLLNWTITNGTDEDFINTVQFNGYVDGTSIDQTFVSDVGESVSAGETLIPGSNLTANTIFEVPATWTQFQERVEIDSFSGESATFNITPDQVS